MRFMKLFIAWSLLTFSVAVSACNQDFCRGQKVVRNNSANEIGKILEVFRSGKVSVAWDGIGVDSVVDKKHLSRSCKCNGNLCKGDRVDLINPGSDTGKVKAIFENGMVKVDWDKHSPDSVVGIKSLGFELGDCHH